MEAITTIDIIITLLIISESIKSGGEGDSPASKRRRLSVSGHEVNILLRHQMRKTTIIGINVMMMMMTRRFLNSWSNAPLLYLDLRLVQVKQLVLDNLQGLDNHLPTTFLIIRLADVIMLPIRQVLVVTMTITMREGSENNYFLKETKKLPLGLRSIHSASTKPFQPLGRRRETGCWAEATS